MTASLVLAFGFASPALLWGLVLGGIPIVIHLLHKRKFRETPWAAMRFLMEAARKHSRRIRLEQLVLLCVRVLILVLLVLALAQPFVETLGTYFRADVPAQRLIAVDASFSMGYRQGPDGTRSESSRLDRAKRMARQIVSASRQGDALNLVRIAEFSPPAIVRQPAYQKDSVIDEIDQLKLTEEPGDVLAALQTLDELLGEAPEISRKEVYLISDFQRADWAPDSNVRAAQIRRSLKSLSQKAELVFLDVGESQTDNAAVTDFVADQSFFTVGEAVPLRATLHNFGFPVAGAPALTGQLVELFVDGQLVQSRRVDLPPGGETTVDFTHTFAAGGEHQVEVRLQDDALPLDNHRRLALPVQDGLSVLLVDGRPAGRAAESATYYLQMVLSPSTASPTGSGAIRPHVIKEGELTVTDLSRYDCVFVCNVGLFTDQEAAVLQSYVSGGGALIVCLGDQVRPENYNLVLYRDGKGLLPAKLGERVGNAENPQDAFGFDPGDLSHPIVKVFEGNPGTGLESALIFEYFRTELAPDSGSRVALRLTTGDPFLVESPVGRGRSLLVTTSVDARWGSWPVQRSFPPLIHEMVRFAVSGKWKERQRLVGEPLLRALPHQAAGLSVTIKRPDGREQPSLALRLGRAEDSADLVYDNTDKSGLYEVVLGPPMGRSELFAVNVDPRESDLTKISEDELRIEWLPGIDFAYRTRWQDFDRDTVVSSAERGGLPRWLLAAVLCLVLIEQFMAWNFFYGFLLLCGAVAAVFVRHSWTWNPLAGAAVLIVLTAGLVALWRWGRRPRPGP